jgi:hypothetical protein
MKMNTLYCSGLAALTLALAGCNTFQSRARQMSGTYEALPPETQQRLQKGAINVGDTMGRLSPGVCADAARLRDLPRAGDL